MTDWVNTINLKTQPTNASLPALTVHSRAHWSPPDTLGPSSTRQMHAHKSISCPWCWAQDEHGKRGTLGW